MEELEAALIEYENAENISDIYNNPSIYGLREVAKGLVKTIPVLGEVLDEAINQGLEWHVNTAKNSLIEAILGCPSIIDPEKIEGVSFLIEFAKTQEVVIRLANDKKVQFICNLFTKYFLQECNGGNIDIYEEFLNQITTLSYREIELLIALKHFEQDIDNTGNRSELQLYSSSYHQLISLAKENWNIEEEELSGMMTSISRSGFCKEIVGSYYGYSGGVFQTTAYFNKFLSYIIK